MLHFARLEIAAITSRAKCSIGHKIMDVFKINIKLFAESDNFGPTEFVPIFHHWIQNQSLPNHLLIDVADYAHVPAGPGTLIVASEANIHMDRGENRLG